MKKVLILLSLGVFFVGSLMADSRDERPLQLQYLPLMGVSAGVHLNKRLYFGMSYMQHITFNSSLTVGL